MKRFWSWLKSHKTIVGIPTTVITTLVVLITTDVYECSKNSERNETKPPKAENKERVEEKEVWGTHILKINKGRGQEVRMGTCPIGPECLIIKLGPELMDPYGIRGVLFYIEGLGFTDKYGKDKHGRNWFSTEFHTKNCEYVNVFNNKDGEEIFLFNSQKRDLKEPPTGFNHAVFGLFPIWIPFTSEYGPSFIKGRFADIKFEITNEKINHLELKIQISDGTLN